VPLAQALQKANLKVCPTFRRGIMNLPEFSVKKSVTVLMLILIIAVFGVMSFMGLGIELMPDISFPVVSCITTYSGVAPEDMETMITKPIEGIVSTVKDVKQVSSISEEGVSVVMVELEWGANLDFAAQDMRDALDMIKDYLPPDASRPMIVKTDISMMPILALSITGERNPLDLRRTAEDIKDKLEQVDGVANVMLMGGVKREIQVKIDRDKLNVYGIPIQQIIQVLRFENLNLPGGRITEEYTDYMVRTVGEFKNIDEIGNITIGVKDRVPIYLKDVAEIEDTHKEMRSYGRTNKKESVILLCSKSSGANTVGAANRVKQKIKNLEHTLPEDIKIYSVFDQGKTTTKVVSTTVNSAMWGAILAVFCLLLVFRNWRPTIIIALAIPLSILATFIAIHIAGFTFNIMTIGGFALGVGMLLSNAIIVIENIFRHLEEGKPRKEAASFGTTEVSKAIFASTLTTVAVFLPLIYTRGMAGQISKGLALTVAFSLLASLLVAFTIVPMIASKIFVQRKRKEEYETHFGERFFERFNTGYKNILEYTLKHRKRVGFGALAVFIISIGLFPFVGKEFIPKMDSSMLTQKVKMPVGTSLEETNRVIAKLEDIAMEQPEAEIVAAFGGESEMAQMAMAMGGGGGVNQGDVMIKLDENRKRSGEEIKDAIRARIPDIEGAKIEFPEMMSGMMGGGGEAPIEIKIFGPDLDVLDRLSLEIMEKIKNVRGVKDIDRSIGEGKPELQIKIDRQIASRIGLTAAQIASQVEVSMKGKVATRFKEKGEEFDTRVVLQDIDRESRSDIGNIAISTPLGINMPLKSIAKIEETKGPVKLLRENQKRKVSVNADFSGRDLGSVMADVQKEVSKIGLPEGYFVEYGGQAERMQETFVSLGAVLLLAILIVYMIMAATFESLVHPLVVMFTLPFAMVGMILILLLTGKTVSLTSLLGGLILVGVIVNAGIVLVDYINQLRARGMNRNEAIIQGGVTKLRTVVLINLTTILGLLPMAVRKGRMSAMMAPMALSVIGGLIVGTILTLVIVPLVYSIFDDLAEKIRKRTKRVVLKE